VHPSKGGGINLYRDTEKILDCSGMKKELYQFLKNQNLIPADHKMFHFVTFDFLVVKGV
jgi:hypothetical protein